MNSYKTSTNYPALYDLVKAGNEIVGYYTITFRKKITLFFKDDQDEDVYISVIRGNIYAFSNKPDFVDKCIKLKLEYIPPYESCADIIGRNCPHCGERCPECGHKPD
jgi:hypothetical protein